MNKSTRLLLGLTMVLAGSAALANGKKDGDLDIEIIHKPGSNAEDTLFVSYNGLKGHLTHGDCVIAPATIGSESPVYEDQEYADFVFAAIDDAGFALEDAIREECGGEGGGGGQDPE